MFGYQFENSTIYNVIPAKAGIQWRGKGGLDSRVKPENDGFYKIKECLKLCWTN
jgi:hypothetical protein